MSSFPITNSITIIFWRIWLTFSQFIYSKVRKQFCYLYPTSPSFLNKLPLDFPFLNWNYVVANDEQGGTHKNPVIFLCLITRDFCCKHFTQRRTHFYLKLFSSGYIRMNSGHIFSNISYSHLVGIISYSPFY